MTFFMDNGTKVSMTVDELHKVLYEVAKKTAQIVRQETISRKETIALLGSRSVLEKYIRLDIIHPLTAGGNCKWKVLVSEVLYAKELHDREKAVAKRPEETMSTER